MILRHVRRLHAIYTASAISAPRESPTPVVFLCGLSLPAECIGQSAILQKLIAAGYGVAVLDVTRVCSEGDAGAVDRAVEAVHGAIRALGSGVPPIAIAHGLSASFAQAYLESYALSGLAMLAPLAPDPRATLARWSPGGLGVDALASAFVSACGHRAARAEARGAASFALALPRVLLEPSPVPILAVRGAKDPWCTSEDLDAVAAHHALDAQQALTLAGPSEADYDFGFREGRSATVDEPLLEWITSRF